MAENMMVHYHIEIRGRHHGCYNISGPRTVAAEAARLGGVMLTIQDDDCPNGRKPETRRYKQMMAAQYIAAQTAWAAQQHEQSAV